ncbi:hypothetical protein HQ535_00370 [bacterium]|nr:hypothetical protein [bacterium]
MTARQAFTLWLTLPAVEGRTGAHRSAELDWLLHAISLENAGFRRRAEHLAHIIIQEARTAMSL